MKKPEIKAEVIIEKIFEPSYASKYYMKQSIHIGDRVRNKYCKVAMIVDKIYNEGRYNETAACKWISFKTVYIEHFYTKDLIKY